MNLGINVKDILFPVGILVLASLTMISCAGPAHHRVYPNIALSEDQVALLSETPDSKGCWTLLIDEEDVHALKGSFWTLDRRVSRTFELAPGNHTVVVIYHEFSQAPTGPGRHLSITTYSESFTRMEFYAEKGHKYLLGADGLDRGAYKGSWNPWIKDISSNQVVSKIISPDPSTLNILGKKCRIDSKFILSSVIKDNILYIPSPIFFYCCSDGADVKAGSVGKVICQTIYKTRESGHWQYRNLYIVEVEGPKRLILVAREGLMPI